MTERVVRHLLLELGGATSFVKSRSRAWGKKIRLREARVTGSGRRHESPSNSTDGARAELGKRFDKKRDQIEKTSEGERREMGEREREGK